MDSSVQGRAVEGRLPEGHAASQPAVVLVRGVVLPPPPPANKETTDA